MRYARARLGEALAAVGLAALALGALVACGGLEAEGDDLRATGAVPLTRDLIETLRARPELALGQGAFGFECVADVTPRCLTVEDQQPLEPLLEHRILAELDLDLLRYSENGRLIVALRATASGAWEGVVDRGSAGEMPVVVVEE